MMRAVFLLLVGIGWPGAAAAQEASPSGPNLLFVLVDDQRNDTLGCAGHPLLRTPNIDRLARQGTRFTNAFVTTSICAASRASILTGLTERTHGSTFGTPPLAETWVTSSYPALLRRAGYRTAYFGKLGVRLPPGAAAELFDQRAFRNLPYLREHADGRTEHIDGTTAEEALAFLRGVEPQTPFCLTVAFSSTHAEDGDLENHYPPIAAVAGMYEDVPMPLPRLGAEVYQEQPEFLKRSLNRVRYHWRWDTPEKYQRNMRGYYRLISGVDHMLGQFTEVLEERGLASNTVIVYAADNGYYMGERGFAGKWSHYEESLRVPLIIQDPRRPAGARGVTLDAVVLNLDWPATLLDLAGVEVPDHYQGRSLVPFLNGETPTDWREEFFCEHLMQHPQIPRWEGVRGARFKYARYVDQDPRFEFLYDLEADPDERTNLVGDPEHEAHLDAARARCDTWQARYEAARRR